MSHSENRHFTCSGLFKLHTFLLIALIVSRSLASLSAVLLVSTSWCLQLYLHVTSTTSNTRWRKQSNQNSHISWFKEITWSNYSKYFFRSHNSGNHIKMEYFTHLPQGNALGFLWGREQDIFCFFKSPFLPHLWRMQLYRKASFPNQFHRGEVYRRHFHRDHSEAIFSEMQNILQSIHDLYNIGQK